MAGFQTTSQSSRNWHCSATPSPGKLWFGGVGGNEISIKFLLASPIPQESLAWVSNPIPEPKERKNLFIYQRGHHGATQKTNSPHSILANHMRAGKKHLESHIVALSLLWVWSYWSQGLDAAQNRTQQNGHTVMTILNPGLSH